MRLDRILKDSGCLFESKDGAIEVSSICCDSRKVTYGSLFVAIKGFASDGHDYIATAIGKGARVIVYEDQDALDRATAALDMEGIVTVRTESSRYAMAIIAVSL
jgi:UDP-N-acetylmuramoyl-L-alanyl-D-glutamate--2,6-diaminopimelate ligase